VSGSSQWKTGKAIRGGIPICFPWFGSKADNPQAPAHGFARTRAWNLEAVEQTDSTVNISMSLEASDDTKALWPHEFGATYTVSFGTTLKLQLQVTNTGDAPFSFEEALHTYYRVGDVEQIALRGLDDTAYLDKTDGNAQKRQAGEIKIVAETDRVFLNTTAEVQISDAVERRKITIFKQNSLNTVVWNPWIEKSRAMADLGDDEWKHFVCVEACNVGGSPVELQPGQEHRIEAITRIETA
jgi:glucose-6-phosphate 1-epimerase